MRFCIVGFRKRRIKNRKNTETHTRWKMDRAIARKQHYTGLIVTRSATRADLTRTALITPFA